MPAPGRYTNCLFGKSPPRCSKCRFTARDWNARSSLESVLSATHFSEHTHRNEPCADDAELVSPRMPPPMATQWAPKLSAFVDRTAALRTKEFNNKHKNLVYFHVLSSLVRTCSQRYKHREYVACTWRARKYLRFASIYDLRISTMATSELATSRCVSFYSDCLVRSNWQTRSSWCVTGKLQQGHVACDWRLTD